MENPNDTADSSLPPNGGIAIRPVNGLPPTLAESVEHEAMAFRSRGTALGDFLATHLERLGQLLRWSGATTPAEHEERMDIWDSEVRARWYDQGWHDGAEAVRAELMPYYPS
jgi:hypothetical protein